MPQSPQQDQYSHGYATTPDNDRSPQATLEKSMSLLDVNFSNIRTFVAVADLCSFKAAGKHLFISASAVSHRMAALEAQLGFKLFHRLTRSIKLTPEGQRLYAACVHGFEKIMAEVRGIKGGTESGTLSVFSHPSVAQSWLTPRLGGFRRLFPQCSLHVRTGNAPVDFATTAFDFALYYADGIFTGLHSHKLMDEEIFPVCSPAYAEEHHLFDAPEQLWQCELLCDGEAWHYADFAAEWTSWNLRRWDFLTRVGILSFDSSLTCALAAVSGAGVAMGRKHIVDRFLAEGSLVEVFPTVPRVRSELAYYLVWPKTDNTSSLHAPFLRWLCERATSADNR